MRRTRSYAKFLAFALAVSLAFQSVPAMAGDFDPTLDADGTGAVYGTVPEGDTSSIAIGKGSVVQPNEEHDPDKQTANAIAVGTGATASDKNATAIGTGAVASGLSTVVIGDGVKANGHYSIAIGYNDGAGAQMTGLNAIAIGTNTAAIGGQSVAIGYIANARGESSLALGNDAAAWGANSVALGYGAKSTDAANNSVALGRHSLANEEYVVSIGNDNDSLKITRRLVNMAAGQANTDAVNVAQLNETLGIFGNNTTVSSTNGTITNNGFTYRDDTTTTTVQDVFTAIDEDIDELDAKAVRYTSRNGTEVLSLVGDGTNIAVSNVADGEVTATSTYAVNGSQLYSLAESIAGKLGVDYTGGTTFGDFSVVINDQTYTNVADAIVALTDGGNIAEGWNINGATGTPGTGGTPGAGTGKGSGSSSVASGGSLNVEAGSNIEISVGGTGGDADLNISVSDTPTFESVTAGSMEAVTITANKSVTVGTGDKQTVIDGTTGTVTVGDSNSNKYTEIGSGKLHVHTNIGGVNGGVLANDIGLQVYNEKGDQVWINNEGTVYIAKGNGNSVTLTNGTGKFTNDNGTTKIDGQKGTFGSTTGDQTVIDGGTVTVDNQITVGGANGTVVDNNSVTVGGTNGTVIDNNSVTVGGTNGTVIDNNSVTVGGTNGTVVDNNSVTVGGAGGTVINNGSVSINNNSAYFRENAMKVGSMTYDGLSNTLNMGGAGRLTGLADGGVYMGSTDAVTGNQLWQAYKRMDQLQESINIVGAHAAALSGLHPIDYNPYEPTTLSAAVGTYRDEYAVAVGVFHYVRENVLFNLGASICSDGDLMGRAGISFTVGKDMKRKPMLARDMAGMQQQMIAMQAKVEDLESERKRDKETLARNAETLKKNEEIMKQNEKLIRELTKRLEAKK